MPLGPDLRLVTARERFALQDYYGAAHLLEELVADGQAWADVHHLLGLSLAMLGQAERALEAYDRALALNPRYVEALVHRGLVLNELGRSDEAEECFRRASRADGPATGRFPAHVAARLANQHAALGEAYADAGAPAEAIEEYRRALVLRPDFPDLRFRLARLLLDAARPLEAREELERVLRVRAGFPEAEAALGLAHFLAGDALAAREVWRAALSRRPEDARIEAYLAMVERVGA